jgi:hypothetical protein
MDEQLNRMAGVSPSAKTFSPKQGQYLAYIHLYTRLHRRPPVSMIWRETIVMLLAAVVGAVALGAAFTIVRHWMP